MKDCVLTTGGPAGYCFALLILGHIDLGWFLGCAMYMEQLTHCTSFMSLATSTGRSVIDRGELASQYNRSFLWPYTFRRRLEARCPLRR